MDIAAHLHDSVLQTLTLIRASAGDPKRVRALTLNEERELRSWLYTGRSEAAGSLAEAVRQSVGAFEGKFGVPVKVITVSDVKPGPAKLVFVATPGGAVTNVLRHGSPPASIHPGVRAEKIETFIRDCGNEFNFDSIPHDRHGVRNSIIGGMERVGGKAHVHIRLSDTEIALGVPKRAENIPHGVPNITHDVLNIPHGIPNIQGVLR